MQVESIVTGAPLWSVPSTAKMILLAPVALAVKQAVVAAQGATTVEAFVMIGALGLAPMLVGESIVNTCVGRPTTAPLELSIAAIRIAPARRPVQLTLTVTRLRSSGWLSAGEVGVLAEQKLASVVPSPSLGSSSEQTVALTV